MLPVELYFFSLDTRHDLIVTSTSGPCPLNEFFKILEANDHASDVVQSFRVDTLVEGRVDSGTTAGMHRARVFEVLGLETCIPNSVHDILIFKFFKYAIATNRYEVVVVFDLKGTDLGRCNHHVRVASIPLIFGLNITNGSGDR